MHRIPCFTDPDFRAGLKENLQQKAQLNKRFSHYYSLSINGGLSPLRCIMPLDLCFSPTCQAHFREYLKREYHSLEALNQEWGTACKSWEEVKAMTFPQARRHGNFAPWADHRMHMEQVFTDINRFARKAILEIDPEAVIGLDEPNATSSYNGYDWPSLMQELDFCNPYFGKWHWRDDQIEAARCFGQKLEAPTGIWFGSYWRGEEFNRFIPWQSLFNGMKGVYWWVGMASRNSSIGALTPDFAPLPYFAQALEEINEIKRGIGKLLLHCTRKHDKIAIHYSTRSIHAATIEANTQLPPEKFPEEEIIKDSMALPDTPTQFGSSYPLYRSQLALMTVLEDIGLQYDFVSPEQLENGEFQAQKYKVLVLPYAKALSPAEAEEIKAFVRNGGLLLADRLPGIMDGHCKHLPQSSLIDLFSQADQKLQVNCHGKGKAVCLHDFLDDYVFSLRRQGREKAKREKIKEFLQLAAVEPGARILDSKGDDLGSTEMVFFRNGAVEFVCLLRDYLSAGSASKEVTIMFPRLAHIYDVRTNQYLGFGNQAALTLRKGQARVFALSPYQVLGVNLALDKEKYRPGDSISVKIDLDTTDNAAAAHVFRIEVLDPEHQTVKHYSRNLLAENGSGAATLTLALNDARGIWTIQASEVMSGKTATKSWLVE
ncbi:MAG: hypothetical protein GX564_06565 [Oligosphaeraceae bacterium]|nr:hypothetical protein [Oligosphaeraceae bacterium]